MSNMYIGCAIWGYRPWVGDFLPAGTSAGDMVRAYAERLTTVEVNSTFYALPEAATIRRWVSDTPNYFRFCPKVAQAISHSGNLGATMPQTNMFIERMRGFEGRLGPIFLQLPPSYGPAQLGDLATWLDRWPPDLALAVEVRHRGWFATQPAAALGALLRERAVGRVLVDVRPINTGDTTDNVILEARRKKPNVPLQLDRASSFALVRFMGHPDLRIDHPLLEDWATEVTTWLAEGTTVFMMMHCPVEERSPQLCTMFAKHLVARGVAQPLPAPAEPPQQMTLF